MIKRDLTKNLLLSADNFQVVALVGPRQSGKTTLVKSIFKKHKYISLENFEMRDFANDDPNGFLKAYAEKNNVILDEIQNTPKLLSYIQTFIDNEAFEDLTEKRKRRNGRFILTGSQNFLINQAISQSLAGRVSIHTLLPLSLNELKDAKLIKNNPDDFLFQSTYPPTFHKKTPLAEWYASYLKSYLERDVRLLENVPDLSSFQKFMKFCAGRIGQTFEASSLSNDANLPLETVNAWLSVLEASYIIFFLPPYYKNFRKQLTKSSKLYFYDSGFASFLLGIKSTEQLLTHYARGALFESAIISELIKKHFNNGDIPSIYFWRDKSGHEIDCIIEKDLSLLGIEIKINQTISSTQFKGLEDWNKITGNKSENSFLIYGGDEKHSRKNINVVGWKEADTIV